MADQQLDILQDLVKRAHKLDAEARELDLINPSTERVLRHHVFEHEQSIAKERARRQRGAENAARVRNQVEDPADREFFASPPPGTGVGEISNARPEMIDWLRSRTGWGKPIHSMRVHSNDPTWVRYYVRANDDNVTPLSLLLEGQARVATLVSARVEQAEEDRHKHSLAPAGAAAESGAAEAA